MMNSDRGTIYVKCVLVYIIYTCILHVQLVTGICPEAKRRYPGDCRLYYRCVLLPVPASVSTADATAISNVAHAYIWIPTHCTAGLIFEPKLKVCVLPTEDWNCNEDELIPVLQYSKSTTPPSSEDITEDIQLATENVDKYGALFQNVMDTEEMKPENEPEIITENIDRITKQNQYQPLMTYIKYMPITYTNHHEIDQIGMQMNELADLANTLKAVSSLSLNMIKPISATTLKPIVSATTSLNQIPPDEYNLLINPETFHAASYQNKVKLLPIQLNKITAQLMHTKQVPMSQAALQTQNYFSLGNSHILKQNVKSNSPALIEQHTQHVVSALFNRYLANRTFEKNSAAITSSIQNNYHVPTNVADTNTFSQSTNEKIQLNVSAFNNKFANMPCIRGVRVANIADCRKYYMCNSKTLAMQSYTCPLHTAFSNIKRMCDVTQYAQCTKSLIVDNKYKQQIIREHPFKGMCKSQEKLPDPLFPKGYILCIKRSAGLWTPYHIICPGTLIFCKQKKLCAPKSSC